MIKNGKTNHQKECYLCGSTEFNKRPDQVAIKNGIFLMRLIMHTAYDSQLAAIGKCDTILASVSRY